MSEHMQSPSGRDQLTSHDYDGIREYDNPTPGWWHAVFVTTIIFSVFYFLFFQFSPLAWTPQDVLQKTEVANLKKQFAELGTLAQDEPTLQRMMSEPKWMSVGESIFRGSCASCHGDKGQGIVGPNMTDDHYKNIKRLGDILNVVNNGAAGGAMPAQKLALHPNEVVLVSAYVAHIRGRFIPGRDPEGERAPAWSAPD